MSSEVAGAASSAGLQSILSSAQAELEAVQVSAVARVEKIRRRIKDGLCIPVVQEQVRYQAALSEPEKSASDNGMLGLKSMEGAFKCPVSGSTF
jgi:hypothetical protein